MLRTHHNYYLVYEYCNGGTLADLIRSQGPLPLNQALAYFQQLREAYRVLHAAHILHRDLKPGNILFHDGVVKLADFGFCKELGREREMTATMVGSPLYMSPEILKGLPYDARADVWSLGVIFYEMLCGVCPFEQSSIAALSSLIDSSPLAFPPDCALTPHLKTLLTRMLEVRLESRMTPGELF
jgi:serine/threonine-protein kinase ULK/ATG1